MSWLYLCLSIVFEVTGTMCLRVAAAGRPRFYVPVVVAYLVSYSCLSLALAAGMQLGVAYGIWTAVGVALTAVLGRVLFGERFTGVMAVGVALVMAGVLMVELGA